jgi:hypothetical protein
MCFLEVIFYFLIKKCHKIAKKFCNKLICQVDLRFDPVIKEFFSEKVQVDFKIN